MSLAKDWRPSASVRSPAIIKIAPVG